MTRVRQFSPGPWGSRAGWTAGAPSRAEERGARPGWRPALPAPRAAAGQLAGRRSPSRAILLFAAGLLLLAGCVRGATAGPPGTLIYEGVQTYTLHPGDALPGTGIRYLGQGSGGAEFLVGDQIALKQKADSLSWSGSPAEGTRLDLRLRIAWYTVDTLYAVGTVRIAIGDVAPASEAIPTDAPLSYQVPVTYSAARGGTVPGTTLRYEGKTADGAQFSGIEGYPYRELGDSLRWDGRLRPNVAVRQELRVVHFDERSARLAGVVHLWITP